MRQFLCVMCMSICIFGLNAGWSFAANSSVDVSCGSDALASAIVVANETPEYETLNLAPSCSYSFAAPYGETAYGLSALPYIASSLTINGNGATLQRQADATMPFRVVTIAHGDVVLRDLTIRNGKSGLDGGGGILNNMGTLKILDSLITENGARRGGGIMNTGVLIVQNSVISHNEAAQGGGVYGYGTEIFAHTQILNNFSATVGGGIADDGGRLYIANSKIAGNRAFDSGGGLYIGYESAAAVFGSVVTGNISEYGAGGGLIANSPSLEVIGTTISGNAAGEGAGGIHAVIGASIVNSIVWDNSSPIERTGFGVSITGTLNSIVEGGASGTANRNEDPLFVDPRNPSEAPTADGDYRLQPGSPAIDAGIIDFNVADNVDVELHCATIEFLHYDADGNSRVAGTRIDIGAYEFAATPKLQHAPLPNCYGSATAVPTHVGEMFRSTERFPAAMDHYATSPAPEATAEPLNQPEVTKEAVPYGTATPVPAP